ncbi:MAG: SGNH/GDSL hydrolase family protein [Oscillospiraceae bacterium]
MSFPFLPAADRFPGAIIVVLTPLHRMGENIPKGERGWLLRDYARVIRDTAAFYGLPLLDLFETSVIRANDPEIAAKLTTDGLHPNDLGHEILAKKLAIF